MIGSLISVLIVVIVFEIYRKFKKSWRFWSDRNVPFYEPKFPAGVINETLKGKLHYGEIKQQVYTQMKKENEDYCGFYAFTEPMLLVLSPEFAKTILVKDFNYFMDRGVYYHETRDPLSANLFFIEGQKWKDLRAKLIPTFTSAKLKRMFHTIFDVGNHFVDYLEYSCKDSNDVEIYDLLARFNTDVISSCAFGFESNSLEEPNNEFRTMGRRMLNFSRWKMTRILFAMAFQNLARSLGIRFNDKDVADFFMNVVRETIEYRKKTDTQRNDFMQLLIELMNRNDDDKLTFNEVAAQAFVFYFAGFETSSTVTCFTLHSLAYHQEIQDKARKSINEILKKYNNDWSYDAVMEMSYLDQVIDESMRLNPPVATLQRHIIADYELPNGATIPKGVKVEIPVLAFHRDPDIFANPLQFDPERFSPEERKNRHSFSFIPFGEGPRYCIGMRFGLLQTKLGIALLLHNFKFSPCEKSENPIKINPVTLIHGPEGDVWLKVEKVAQVQ